MADETIEGKFNVVVSAVADLLKREGFKKTGTKFRRQRNENLELIEFQRSVNSDRDGIQFTANIGVVSSKLLRTLEPEADIQKQGVWRAHLREHLGFFRNDPTDHWWEVLAATNDDSVAQEVKNLIADRVLPFLQECSNDEGLAKLWRSGRSPGLTEFQRNRNLAALS